MHLLVHYSEIGIKGKNKRFFEQKLKENIKKVLPPGFLVSTQIKEGRILSELLEDLKPEDFDLIKERLKKVFGIAYFSFSNLVSTDIEKIKLKALEVVSKLNFKSFKVETKRAFKAFPLNSIEVGSKVGEVILKKFKDKKVDLKNPDLTLFIEILKDFTLIYSEKIEGSKGLPISSSGKVVSLLSGGIDSPVASWQIAKRGCEVILVHFHSYPYTSKASIEKAEKIAKILAQWHLGEITLYLVPFGEVQKEIVLKSKAKLRMIFYRRAMFKIAEKIAFLEKAKALVTGESLGQVASQTLENIFVIQSAITLPVLRPLIGLDKEEIIKKAKELKTFEVSILPHEDCCSRFLPSHPETKAKLEKVEKEEAKFNLDPLIEDAISLAQRKTISAF